MEKYHVIEPSEILFMLKTIIYNTVQVPSITQYRVCVYVVCIQAVLSANGLTPSSNTLWTTDAPSILP